MSGVDCKEAKRTSGLALQRTECLSKLLGQTAAVEVLTNSTLDSFRQGCLTVHDYPSVIDG